jgi:hypothetical protein
VAFLNGISVLISRKQFVIWFVVAFLLIAQLGTVLHAANHLLDSHDDSCQVFVHAEKHHSYVIASDHNIGIQYRLVYYEECGECIVQKNQFLIQQARAPPVLS